jgi:predicted transposase/invertase (TIGR01784 family)
MNNKSKKQKNNKNSHDVFVKKAMSDKNVAKEFFEANLPQDILSQVDLGTLKQEKENYFDNTLGHGIVDLIYSANFGEDKGYLILLLEHQSTQDYNMPLRIMKYILKICDDYLKKNKGQKIPLIYPILFYGGETKYTAPLSLWSLFNNSERAKAFLTKPIQLVETNNFRKEDIRGRAYFGLMMYFMSRIREKDIFTSLQEVVELINRISNEGNIEYIESILYYVMERADSEKVEGILSEFKKAVTPEHSERLMTIAERLKEQGKEIGIQIGIEKGIEKGKEEGVKKVAINMLLRKLDEKIISESTGLTIEEIQKLKQN